MKKSDFMRTIVKVEDLPPQPTHFFGSLKRREYKRGPSSPKRLFLSCNDIVVKRVRYSDTEKTFCPHCAERAGFIE